MAKTYSIQINNEQKVYRCITPLARGSYMQGIIEPRGFSEGDKPEWGCQLRWPIDDDETKQFAGDMSKLFKQILLDKFGDKAEAMIKNPQLKIPLRNGNNEEREEYHGYLFMNVKNKFRQPHLLAPTAAPLTDDLKNNDYFYSGAWYRAKLTFGYYDQIGKGIGAWVEVLMKIKDDDRWDSGTTPQQAQEEFAGFAVEADEAMTTDRVEAPEDDTSFDFL